ncbi:permease-like cell division protein FtsX [Methylomarinum sp. Ch1-1]|uniref:Cell division protein FtsX n=1 Tax=Methylomarinum roseum TaxID=3067653 RepID=A0AAU7NQ14_9GAMM|nr:permease-like cell division protein FtsX [Methylomarinum sp. Ch1-1]MDP4521330.1 permease-like cell division protein FtsX [Methylomarinum sp. Ch1-1]
MASAKKQTQHKSTLSDRGLAYLLSHAHALFSSLGRLTRSPFTSIMTVLVLAVTVSLAGSFYLLVNNARQLTGNLESSNQISLFLKTTVSDAAGKKLAKQIGENGLVEQVKVISKSQAMDEFKAYSGFGEALNTLDSNPLPTVIQVLPKNSLQDEAAVEKLMQELGEYPQVDFVQMDMQWVKRLQSMMQLAGRSVTLLNILLGFAVIFITGNTIRLELQNRREEVLIAKLVGATHSFVQRPFVYTGLWLGFFAGVSAWVIVTIMVWVLQGPLEKLSLLYDGSFHMLYFSFSEALLLLLLSTSAGALGAWIVLHYQLRLIKPQ